MQISTRGRYSIKALVFLAANEERESITLKEIAQRTGISEGYLEQLFIQLKKENIVKGTPGVNGGYVLTKSSREIRVGDVLRAVERAFSTVGTDEQTVFLRQGSAIQRMWLGLQQEINAVVDAVTLEQIAMQYNGMADRDDHAWYYTI